MRQLQTPESMRPDHMEPIPPSQSDQTPPFDVDDSTIKQANPENKSDPKPSPPVDDSDAPGHQELQLLDAIYKQTIRVSMLGMDERKLANQLEELRAELTAAREMKSSLLNELPDTLLQLRDGIVPDRTNETIGGDDIDKTGEGESLAESQPTKSILDDIPRLGKKKAEALAEAYPTLADLENARADAAKANQHFADKLPSGIGKKIADELTDRLIDALAGNNISASEQVKQNRPAEPAADESTVEAEEHQWLEFFVEEVREANDFDSHEDPDAWRAGYDAFESNLSIESIDHDQDVDSKMDWVRGWLNAESFEKEAVAAAEAEEKEDVQAESLRETDSTGPDGDVDVYDDIDDDETENEELGDDQPKQTGPKSDDPPSEKKVDIEAREEFAEFVRDSDETQYTHDKQSWQSGYEASIDEQPLEACPGWYSDEQESDWIRGWVEGSKIGSDL
jgi:ribosome modulation factor